MSRMNWNRPRPVHVPWYSNLERDPFGHDRQVSVERKPRAGAKWKAKTRPSLADISGAGDIPNGELTLRTGNMEDLRERLRSSIVADVWCDGCCEPNPGAMGWGVVILVDGERFELFGGHPGGTNNRAELMPAISALRMLPLNCATVVHCDSQYVVLGVTQWSEGWKRKNWKRGGSPIPNADLWQLLDEINPGPNVQWKWVRGHAGNRNNEMADQLAAIGRESAR